MEERVAVGGGGGGLSGGPLDGRTNRGSNPRPRRAPAKAHTTRPSMSLTCYSAVIIDTMTRQLPQGWGSAPTRNVLTYTGSGGLPGPCQCSDESEPVLPIDTVSSADVTRSSSSMKCKAHATDWLLSEDVSVTGDSISSSPRDLRVPAAPDGV